MKSNIRQEICWALWSNPISPVLITLLQYLCISPKRQSFHCCHPGYSSFSTLDTFPRLKGKWQQTQSNTAQSFPNNGTDSVGFGLPLFTSYSYPLSIDEEEKKKIFFWLCFSDQFLTSWYVGVWFSHQGFFLEGTQWTDKKTEKHPTECQTFW